MKKELNEFYFNLALQKHLNKGRLKYAFFSFIFIWNFCQKYKIPFFKMILTNNNDIYLFNNSHRYRPDNSWITQNSTGPFVLPCTVSTSPLGQYTELCLGYKLNIIRGVSKLWIQTKYYRGCLKTQGYRPNITGGVSKLRDTGQILQGVSQNSGIQSRYYKGCLKTQGYRPNITRGVTKLWVQTRFKWIVSQLWVINHVTFKNPNLSLIFNYGLWNWTQNTEINIKLKMS